MMSRRMARTTTEPRTELGFELESFEWTTADRLELTGRWFGVRGRRFMRPVVNLRVDGRRRRMIAVLDHKPWAADAEGTWIAAFAWRGEHGTITNARLEVAPDVVLDLPAPGDDAGGAILHPRPPKRDAPKPRTESPPAKPQDAAPPQAAPGAAPPTDAAPAAPPPSSPPADAAPAAAAPPSSSPADAAPPAPPPSSPPADAAPAGAALPASPPPADAAPAATPPPRGPRAPAPPPPRGPPPRRAARTAARRRRTRVASARRHGRGARRRRAPPRRGTRRP